MYSSVIQGEETFYGLKMGVGISFSMFIIEAGSIYLLVFWLLGVFHPTREFFHSYGDVTMTGERLQILTYAQHSWPLSSKGSLACHTYCDTGHLFIMVISEGS